ncbi:hypothetical protein SGRI78S_06805 [Streptomyces griseus subsp. griseus]
MAAVRSWTKRPISSRRLGDPVAGERGQGHDGGAGLAVLAERDAVLVEEAAQVVEDEVGRLAGQPVGLVEDDEGDLGVSGERAQVALVEGGVGVLLRVDDPDHRVDQRQHPVHLVAVLGGRRVVVGQVDQDEPLERLVERGGPRVRPAPQPPGDGEAVQQAGGPVGPAARDGLGGGGAAQSGVGDRGPGERVEQGRLPAAGGSGDGDDRVPRGEALPGGGLVQHASRLGEGVPVEPGAGEADELAQGVEPGRQRPAGGDVRLDLRLHVVLGGRAGGGSPGLAGLARSRAPGDEPVVPAPVRAPVRLRRAVSVVLVLVRDGGHRCHLSFCSTDSAAISSAWGSGATSSTSRGARRRSRSPPRTWSR